MTSLKREYKFINSNVKTIFVTPSIERTRDHNSYLYLLYKDLMETDDIKIKNIRVAEFPKLIMDRLIGNQSILHHHWFGFQDTKSFLIIIWTCFWMILYKLLGGKIVWTVHNRIPHKKCCVLPNIFIRKLFAKFVDKLHVHCEKAVEIMQPILQVDVNKFFIVEHPMYKVNLMSKNAATKLLLGKYPVLQEKLTNEKKIFLIFGAMSRYKGITKIIETFNYISKRDDYVLLIVGACNDKEYLNEIDTMSKNNQHIIVINKLIPENDLDLFFNSVDYLLFNYEDILTSGGVYLAMSYNKIVFVPNLGCLKELNYKNSIHFDTFNKTLILNELDK